MTDLTKNFIPLTSIYVPSEENARIRETSSIAKAVVERTKSIQRLGQLQPILVERLENPIDGKVWRIIDGQVRWISLMGLTIRAKMGDEDAQEAFEAHEMKLDHIEATSRAAMTPEMALMLEYHANEDRDDFTWDERARYIRRIHDMHQEKHGRKNWSAIKTAEAIGQSRATVSHYLQLTDEQDPATQSERVKGAKTKNTAIKQLKIEKEKIKREARVERARVEDTKTEEAEDYSRIANLAVYKGDCREWIKKIPDNSLSWFHWDPPYGGAEGRGGAFAAHEGIQTEHEYAIQLLVDMLPEIWRVLHDGAWICLWYTPVHYGLIRLLLQGHRFSSETSECFHCGKHIIKDHTWLSENYSCVKSPYKFWVNPYPNLWRKTDRTADGHEITRFFTKETEPFLLAGKQHGTTPILTRSDRGNVFDFPGVEREVRRHVNHKPWELLEEIISCISVPGSLGGDAGAGSGSIIEAAFNGRRKVVVAEVSTSHFDECTGIYTKRLRNRKASAKFVAPWLEDSFGEK